MEGDGFKSRLPHQRRGNGHGRQNCRQHDVRSVRPGGRHGRVQQSGVVRCGAAGGTGAVGNSVTHRTVHTGWGKLAVGRRSGLAVCNGTTGSRASHRLVDGLRLVRRRGGSAYATGACKTCRQCPLRPDCQQRQDDDDRSESRVRQENACQKTSRCSHSLLVYGTRRGRVRSLYAPPVASGVAACSGSISYNHKSSVSSIAVPDVTTLWRAFCVLSAICTAA